MRIKNKKQKNTNVAQKTEGKSGRFSYVSSELSIAEYNTAQRDNYELINDWSESLLEAQTKKM